MSRSSVLVGLAVDRDWNRAGICVGRSASRSDLVLRSEVRHYFAGVASLRALFSVGADGGVARGSGIAAVHF